MEPEREFTTSADCTQYLLHRVSSGERRYINDVAKDSTLLDALTRKKQIVAAETSGAHEHMLSIPRDIAAKYKTFWIVRNSDIDLLEKAFDILELISFEFV